MTVTVIFISTFNVTMFDTLIGKRNLNRLRFVELLYVANKSCKRYNPLYSEDPWFQTLQFYGNKVSEQTTSFVHCWLLTNWFGASLLRNYTFYKSLQLLVLFMTQYRHLSNGNCLVWMFYLRRSVLIQSSANLEPKLTFISTFTISKESLEVEVELSWKCSVKTTIEPLLFVSDYCLQPLVRT